MRAVIQRVSEAAVKVDGKVIGEIGKGLLILLGVEGEDTDKDGEWLAGKISSLRIFSDQEGLMNHNVQDVNGGLLVVSQFTLHAKTQKGTRPSFIRAAKPDIAVPLYERFVEQLRDASGTIVETGEFGAMMDVSLINDGPVTIWIDTKRKE